MLKAHIGRAIIDWYRQHRRELPWRSTQDPYRIWLSEIMLQQTRVAQGLPYYEKFISKFPTVRDLADASETEVLKAWQGLGYYSRARNLHRTAKYVAYELGGVFPLDYRGLLKLRGVGPYTAAAIASFCYGEAVPVFDGNVYRVISRYFGVREPVNSTVGRKEVERLGHEIMVRDEIADFNQGIMEFGALQCKPKSPDCPSCPLLESCQSHAHGLVAEIPVKLRKRPVRELHFNYLVYTDADLRTVLEKRDEGGIWPGLYQFPIWESGARMGGEEALRHLESEGISGLTGPVECVHQARHQLSHRTIHADFWRVPVAFLPNGVSGVEWSAVREYPLPVLIERFLQKVDFH